MAPLHLRIIFFIILAISFCGCRKNIPGGSTIQADDFVIDSVKNKKLPHVPVYLISGHKSGWGGVDYYGVVDSTATDFNGSFAIKYTADGNSYDYALSIDKLEIYSTSQFKEVVPDDMHSLYPFNFKTHLQQVAVSARELNY